MVHDVKEFEMLSEKSLKHKQMRAHICKSRHKTSKHPQHIEAPEMPCAVSIFAMVGGPKMEIMCLTAARHNTLAKYVARLRKVISKQPQVDLHAHNPVSQHLRQLHDN